MKKVFSLILALLMLCMTFVSCASNDEDNDGEITAEQTVIGDDGLVYDENGYLMDDLGTKDFEGKEINISGWSEVVKHYPEYSVESLGADIVSDAAYKRNEAVERRMNVKLSYQLISGWTGPGGNAGQEQLTRVQNAAGTDEINLIATYSWNPATFLVNGYLADMNSMQHISLESPWWNQSVLEKNTIYGKVYFATGDIAPSYIGATYAIFFNKQIVSEYKLGDIYELYDDGNWTLQKMMQLSKKVGSDVDGFGTKNAGDKFGFSTSQTPTDAFLAGWNILTVENELDGSLKIGESFGGEKMQNLLSTLITFSNREDALFDTGTLFEDSWLEGDVLFILEEFSSVKDWVTAGMTKFGVLPMPKYDAEQTEYYTIPGFYHTVYCVPITMGDDEATGAALECLASESYRKVTPAYFENIFQSRYSEGSDEATMFGAIRDSVVIDAGRLFSTQLGSKTWMPFRNSLYAGDTGWMSAFDGMEGYLNERIKILNEKVAALES
ncbi:MAG: hypothetical protein IKJ00_06495 [Clostridia bacterium]|nr:hypothetical protein [Clostridia bacterium]